MAKTYTAIPYSYLDECAALTDAEFGALIRALLRYSMTGEVIKDAGNARFFARRMMNQEDAYRQRYDQTVRRRSEAGKQGAAARWGGGAAGENGKCHDENGKCHEKE